MDRGSLNHWLAALLDNLIHDNDVVRQDLEAAARSRIALFLQLDLFFELSDAGLHLLLRRDRF